MKTKPILFNGEMVRAILDGRRTQTRRVVKFPKWADYQTTAEDWDIRTVPWARLHITTRDGIIFNTPCGMPSKAQQDKILSCPYGVPGDRLWVRETWRYRDTNPPSSGGCPSSVQFRADGSYSSVRWRPSIHMPRWASRITLEVLSVRVERVQDISARDAWAEGVRCDCTSPVPQCAGNINAFWGLWDSINAKRGYSWAVNPWVWVVGFKVVGD